MNNRRRGKMVARIALGLVGMLLLTMIVWGWVAGPVTVLRILRFGDTDIDDHTQYPGRKLSAAQRPIPFEASPSPLEIPPAILSEFGEDRDLEAIFEENDTIAVIVLRGESIVYERYFQGHSAASISQLFSVSKSITSALIGMAIQDGYLESADQPITDWIPELAEAGFGEVTLTHLLTMTSGSDYIENDNPFGEHVIMNFTPALETHALTFAMERGPGESFRYKSGDNALLALALDRALGEETITSYAQRRLWDPLGMEHDAVWSVDRDGGLEKTWCCLAASARDLAKIGRLYLAQGQRAGQQILDAEWIRQSTQIAQVPPSSWPDDYARVGWRSYGYQWWLASEETGDFFALGKDGQFLYVDPQHDVTIVRLGWSQGGLRASSWVRLFQLIAAEIG